MLTAEQQKLREGHIGGTIANIVMSDDIGDEINQAWEEAVGIADPPDLTHNWHVQRGNHMEKFALDWHQDKSGMMLTRRGSVIEHPVHRFIATTLDAYREQDDAVIDYKDCGAFMRIDDILAHYTPQSVLQRLCVQASKSILLVSVGGGEPVEHEIEVDQGYEVELLNRMQTFWQCVQSMTRPVPLPPVIPPEKWRRYAFDYGTKDEDMPNWAPELIEQVLVWTNTKDKADQHEIAIATIKKLLPADVGNVAIGNSVDIKRNKKGHVSISRRKK